MCLENGTSDWCGDNEADEYENEKLRNKLEEILKLMLVIWCRENQALKIIVTHEKQNGSTGFSAEN